MAQFGERNIDLKVSGNGTTNETLEVALRHQARFVLRQPKITSEEHIKTLFMEASEEASYVWLIADDDIVAPGAVEKVWEIFSNSSRRNFALTGVLGRSRYFDLDDPARLRAVAPIDAEWIPGFSTNLDDLAARTRGVVRFGTFVVNSNLVSRENLAKFDGTAHGLFGGFWEGLKESARFCIQVLEDPLVFLRVSKKEWDDPRITTLLGRRRFERLLPPEVAKEILRGDRRLTNRQALKLASEAQAFEKHNLRALVLTYDSFELGSRFLSKTPRLLATFFLSAFNQSIKIVDSIYARLR